MFPFYDGNEESCLEKMLHGKRKRALIEDDNCGRSDSASFYHVQKRRRSCASVDDGYGENSNSSFCHKTKLFMQTRDPSYHSRGNSCDDACCRRRHRRCGCHGRSDSGWETAFSTRARRRRSRRHGPRSNEDDERRKHPSSLFESRRRRVEDDEEGHLIYRDGDVLHSRYRLGRLLGQGTFGQVVDCTDLERDSRPCVVKIVRKMPDYYDLAKVEVDILEKLNELDPNGKSRCVKMLDWFDYHGHICIVFDKLGHSVYEFLKRNCYRPFTIDQVQRIANQLIEAVQFCHDQKLTHTDLKPENVLFVDSSFDLCADQTSRAARVRCSDYRKVRSTDIQIIDFGSATFEDDLHGKLVGTRQYRAPEVVLELDWSYPSDVWSLACVIYELYTGRTLFETHDDLEHFAIMERLLGPIPASMASKVSGKKAHLFHKNILKWDLHSSAALKLNRRIKPLKSYVSTGSVKERQLFDLLNQMLVYKPSRRITLREALRHPFFTGMDSLREEQSDSRRRRDGSRCRFRI